MRSRFIGLAVASATTIAGIAGLSTPASAGPAEQCVVTYLGNTRGKAECTGPLLIRRISADCEAQPDPYYANLNVPAGVTQTFTFGCTYNIRGISYY